MGGGEMAAGTLLLYDSPPSDPAGVASSCGPTEARRRLYDRFAPRIQVNCYLSRKLVSYQGNKSAPGLRWLKYKEGFSAALVRGLLEQTGASRLLDPFSGAGTSPLTAAGMGIDGTGIEIMPVGNLAARAIAAVNALPLDKFAQASGGMLDAIAWPKYNDAFLFPHVAITRRAFPESTEKDLAKAREFIAAIADPSLAAMLTLACVSVLEEISYTRKDGQFLRWDPQSGRDVSRKLHKACVPSLRESLRRRLAEIAADLPVLRHKYKGGAAAQFIDGSSLTQLRHLPAEAFDVVITSPPYANRYDYTRTYALELAYLGYDADDFKNLRQSLLSATVENRSKREWLAGEYGGNDRFRDAVAMVDSQEALQEALNILKANAERLSNRNVINLVENYFTEMALIVSELGRLVMLGGGVFMVNDNVRYHGEEIPVDLILSDFAEQCGFRCEVIWTLKQGKGNSSQQMGRYGRQEIRKCVYYWRKVNG